LAWEALHALLTGGPAQWLEVAAAAGGARLALRVDDLSLDAWLRACPDRAAGVEGEVLLRPGADAAPLAVSLMHDADGRPRLNDRDLGAWLRDIADGLAR
jgi:hypothetical protein